MGEWILWGLNVAALAGVLTWFVWGPSERRGRRKLLERGLDHLAKGGPYATFDFFQGPIEVRTQDGAVIATLPLGSDSARLAEANRVLKRHGWQTVGPRAMPDLDTLVVPVTHQPVRTLPSPHPQGEL